MDKLDNAALAKLRNELWKGSQPVEESWASLLEAIKKEVAIIKEAEARGESVVPQIPYADVAAGRTTEEQKREIKRRGCVIIKNTVPQETVAKWYEETVQYLAENDYLNAKGDGKVVDPKNFFTNSTPQIYGVYWCKPQVEARQHPNMAAARAFLNNLWVPEGATSLPFAPDIDVTYADRLRMRTPGNEGGLPPHVDGGSVERWADPGYQQFYKAVYSGEWEKLDPFDGVARVAVEEWPSPNVSTFFRSYQGWLAVTAQGPGDGTLQVVPMVKEATSYLLLRPFIDASEEDPLCGAIAGKQHRLSDKWHSTVLEGLVTIPRVEQGDTVWWHPDLIHAVEKLHSGSQNSSVFYIPAGPLCTKNARYLVKQRTHFLQGKAGPDFPQDDAECKYKGRGQLSDLTPLGKSQLGFSAWDLDGSESADRLQLLRECANIIYSDPGSQ